MATYFQGATDTLRLGTAIVDLAGGLQTIFTVPSSKRAIVTGIVVRDPSGALVLGAVGLGFDANATNVLTAQTFAALSAAGKLMMIAPTAGATVGESDAVFSAKPTVSQAVTVTVDVLGYLV